MEKKENNKIEIPISFLLKNVSIFVIIAVVLITKFEFFLETLMSPSVFNCAIIFVFIFCTGMFFYFFEKSTKKIIDENRKQNVQNFQKN